MNTDKSPELQDAISFDDFMGVELRVGTVIEADGILQFWRFVGIHSSNYENA